MRDDFFRLSIVLILSAAAGCSEDALDQLPALTGLEVTGTKTALNPPFSSDVFRYSVIADDSTEEVAFTPTTSQPAIISVNDTLTSSGAAYSTSTLSPGDVVRIEVQAYDRQQEESTVYEVLYLPADFPQLTVTTLEDGVSSEPLYVTLNGRSARYIAILDNHGVPTFFRAEAQPVFDFKWHSVTGERSYLRHTATRNEWGRRDAEAVILDTDFKEIERITTVGLSHTDVHDFVLTPYSEVILIAYEGALRDLTAFGLTAEELVEESVIQILDRGTRQVLFQWNSWDHVPFTDQTYPALRAEYAHVNSVIEDFDGNPIISARGTSQAIKISRPGGQVLWKLGGKSNQFSFINDPLPHLCGQHTVSRLENGNLLIFDNGQNCWPVLDERGNLTRVVEYRIDEQTLEAELVWSYAQDGAYSESQGSAQRLRNGNTLIGWGAGPEILATEVTSMGKKVFEITAYDNGPVVSYRARRYPQ